MTIVGFQVFVYGLVWSVHIACECVDLFEYTLGFWDGESILVSKLFINEICVVTLVPATLRMKI